MSRHISIFKLIFFFLSACVILFLIAPLLSMMFSSNLKDIVSTARSSEVYSSIWLTLWTSMLVTIIFSFFSIPLAYILARQNFPFKKLLCAILDIPIIIPHSAAGIAILGVLSKGNAFGRFASNVFGLNFVDHPSGIMAAMAFVSLPYLINAAKDGFEAVPLQFEKAAYTLGASHLKVFLKISLPLSWRAIISGFILMFGRGLSEFGAVVIIAYHPMVTSVLIFDRFNSFGLKYAQPVAIIFVIVCIIFFVILRLLSTGTKTSEHSRYL